MTSEWTCPKCGEENGVQKNGVANPIRSKCSHCEEMVERPDNLKLQVQQRWGGESA